MIFRKSILLGIILALVFSLFFNGLIHTSILLILGVKITEFRFVVWGFSPVFYTNIVASNLGKTILVLLPLILNIAFVELSFIVLSRTGAGFLRNTIITLLLILIGYIVVAVFYGMIELLINSPNIPIWENIIQIWSFSENQVYGFVGFIILALFTYLQIVQKRIMKFIVVNKLPQT